MQGAGMIIDHIGITVSNFSGSKAFYTRTLAPLGIEVVKDGEGWALFGKDGKGEFWIGEYGDAPKPIHIAFAAADRAQVQAFYDAAIGAGGRDNGAPGLRGHYHPDYFGAFVFDPDGHNIEAVCHDPG